MTGSDLVFTLGVCAGCAWRTLSGSVAAAAKAAAVHEDEAGGLLHRVSLYESTFHQPIERPQP